MNQKQMSEVPNPGNDLTYVAQTVPGTVAITDNARDSPQSVSLTGTGVAGMCFRKGANCTTSRQCCTGLHCAFNNNPLRPAYQCE